jgi:hypothetical protein
MSVGSFTFRCGECNRLLGVARSRVGQTIVCPKCGTEQPVPAPDLLGDSGTPSGSVVTPPAGPTGMTPLSFGASVPLAGSSSGGVAVPPASSTAGGPVFAGLQLDPEPLSIRPTESARSRPARRAEAVVEVGEPGPGAGPRAAVADDLVIPRAAVRFWTLASLVGSIGSFLAGLLAGHFLWR